MRDPRDLAREIFDPYSEKNFKHQDRDDLEWIEIGKHDEKVYNFYQAEASFKLAGEAGRKHREQLIRSQATKNPTRAAMMLEDDDPLHLKKFVAEQADKKKLHLLRDYIQKNF